MGKDIIETIVREHSRAMLHIAAEHTNDRDTQIRLMALQIHEASERLNRAGFYP